MALNYVRLLTLTIPDTFASRSYGVSDTEEYFKAS